MSDQSYQQLYMQKQIISLSESYPCPRCKSGKLEPFGETETFSCRGCSRKFVAINAGHILYPAGRLKIKIAPIFWWDGLRWHLAGTTASPAQNIFASILFVAPLITINIFAFLFNHGQLGAHGQALNQSFFLNLGLLNILVVFFMAQLFYLFCWDQNGSAKRSPEHSRQIRH